MKTLGAFCTILLMLFVNPAHTAVHKTQRNRVLEISFASSKQYGNSFRHVDFSMKATDADGRKVTIPGFWAGGSEWRIRFSSPRTGTFDYVTECSDDENTGLRQQGKIVVSEYDGTNPLYAHGGLRPSTNGRYLEHLDGTPFLWLADSWWHGMTTRLSWPDGFKTLASDRREKGFSVIQFAIGFPCDIYAFDQRGANEAGHPMTRGYESVNPAYFDLVDQRLEHLIDRGLMPNILGTWGYYLPWMGAETMKEYWRYIIARYGAYLVAWTVAGESTLTWYLTPEQQRQTLRDRQREGWSDIAKYIEQTDPWNRILTVHPGPASGRFRPISDMSTLDIIMVQPGHKGWDAIPTAMAHLNKARRMFPERPVMQGEVCFEGMHGGGSGPKVQRILFWANMLSGAAGHCYGADAIWQFNTKDRPLGNSPGGYTWGNTPWQTAYKWLGSKYVGLGRRILQQFEWWRFEPHPEWVEPHATEQDAFEPYAAGIEGELRLIYFPDGVMPWGGKYTVNNLDPDRQYVAEYLDPLTGDRHPIVQTITGVRQWHVPAGPILQDWLLVIRTHSQQTTSVHEPVNPNASKPARRLLRRLYEIRGTYTLSGQHNYPGTISSYTEQARDITGKYPAVWGQDFGFTETGQDGIDNRQDVIDEAVRKHRQGFIITLMWHAVRPIDNEPNGWKQSVQNDLTDEQWNDLVTPGSVIHQKWLAQMDTVAQYLTQLRDAGVPVLWRPYHEMNGRWFWWGGREGKRGFRAIWRHMYERYVHHHRLDNLLWVWNANAPRKYTGSYEAFFPGHDVVDVLAADVYHNDYRQSHHDDLVTLARGKPVALGECGQLPTPEILSQQPQWTWFMCWAGFLTKRNDAKDVVALFDAERVLNKQQLIEQH